MSVDNVQDGLFVYIDGEPYGNGVHIIEAEKDIGISVSYLDETGEALLPLTITSPSALSVDISETGFGPLYTIVPTENTSVTIVAQ